MNYSLFYFKNTLLALVLVNNFACQASSYYELDTRYYPKSVALIAQLTARHPKVLQDFNVQLCTTLPSAAQSTIYLPMKWAEEIEKNNKFYIETTEWFVLHEAGCLHNYNMLKLSGALLGFIFFWGSFTHEKSKPEYQKGLDAGKIEGFCILGMLGFAGLATYLMSSRAYYADDFAMEHCNNPAVWIAAYEYIERFYPLGWLAGLTNSFTKYRLSRIRDGFYKRFGYHLEFIPQSMKKN
jgi:hypothetical protein